MPAPELFAYVGLAFAIAGVVISIVYLVLFAKGIRLGARYIKILEERERKREGSKEESN